MVIEMLSMERMNPLIASTFQNVPLSPGHSLVSEMQRNKSQKMKPYSLYSALPLTRTHTALVKRSGLYREYSILCALVKSIAL